MIATAVTVPFVVIAAFALAAVTGNTGSSPSSDGAPLPAITASAPPQAVAQTANCAKVLATLPISLGKLTPRIVHTTPDSPNVVAWGNPAVVLSCGVARPKQLTAGSGSELQSGGELIGPYYLVTRSGDANVWTTVDRAAYIAITIPAKYQGADYIPTLTRAIARALPAVCATDPTTADPAKLCTRRK